MHLPLGSYHWVLDSWIQLHVGKKQNQKTVPTTVRLLLVIIPKLDCVTAVDTILYPFFRCWKSFRDDLKHACVEVRRHFIGSVYRHCHLREWT